VRSDFTTREYRSGDEKEINDLFNFVFKQNRPLSVWYWQYRDNPAGISDFIALAESGSRIVGQHANIPIYFKLNDKILKTVQSVDNFIHPDFRGGKIIKETYRLACELFIRGGVSFGYGFPNNIYYPIGKRWLKYKDLCPLLTLFKRLNWRLASVKRFPFLPSFLQSVIQKLSANFYRLQISTKGISKEKILIKKIPTLSSDIDKLWEITKDRYKIIAIRDQSFLKWRYIDNPNDSFEFFIAYQEKPIGYIVVKIAQKGDQLIGYIVDILSIDKTVDTFLIGTALNYFISKKVDYSLCRILKEDEVYDVLMNYGFSEKAIFPPTPVIYEIFDYSIFPDEKSISFFKSPGNWHLTYGDQIDAEF
jgi:hypothetical protein